MSAGDQELHAQSMTELKAGLDSGEFSSVELTRSLLDRIAALDSELNAFITVTADEGAFGFNWKSGIVRKSV